jgi:hypothetical protein
MHLGSLFLQQTSKHCDNEELYYALSLLEFNLFLLQCGNRQSALRETASQQLTEVEFLPLCDRPVRQGRATGRNRAHGLHRLHRERSSKYNSTKNKTKG